MKATCYSPAPLLGGTSSIHHGFRLSINRSGGSPFAAGVAGLNVAGEQEVTLTFDMPSDATTWDFARFYHGGPQMAGQPDVWWDDLIVIEGDYSGGYFDGSHSYPYVPSDTSRWVGTPNDSLSILKKYTDLQSPGSEGDSYFIDDDIWIFTEGTWVNFGPYYVD